MSSLPQTQSRPDYYHLALEMAVRFGAEAFPVTGKHPAKAGFVPHEWGEKALGKPGVHDTPAWLNPHVTGYALTPPVGSLLAFLDMDQPDIPPNLAFLPLNTFTVRRGDHRHFYLYLARPMDHASYKYGQIDLRTEKHIEIASLRGVGAYVVGPGSRHESGDMYEIANNTDPVHLTDAQTDRLFAFFNVRPGRSAAPESLPRPKKSQADQVESRTNPRLIEEIIRRLEAREGRTLNFSPAGTASLFKNPIRPDDEHRSSYFSRVTGWIHDRAGQSVPTAEVCNMLAIRMTDYGGLYAPESVAAELPALEPPPVDEPTKPPRTAWAQGGLPDDLRELMLNIDNETGLSDQAPAVLVWDLYCMAVNRRLLADGEHLTIRALTDAAESLKWETTRWTVEKGVEQLLAWGVLRDVTDESGRYEKEKPFLSDTPQNSTGRPAKVFRFRRLKAAMASIMNKTRIRVREFCFGGVTGKHEAIPDEPHREWFPDDPDADWKAEQIRQRKLSDEQAADHRRAVARYEKAMRAKEAKLHLVALIKAESTALPADRTYKNIIEYRDNLYLGKVRANPGRQISRAQVAKELGRSQGALSAATKRAGVVRVPVYESFELQPGQAVWPQIRGLAAWAETHPGAALVSILPDGDITNPDDSTHLNNPNLEAWAAHQFIIGQKVFLRVQVASREQVGEAQPPEPRKRSLPDDPAPECDVEPFQSPTVWRGFSPLYVKRQLKLRGLADTDGGLIDLATGEILVAPGMVQP